MALPPFFSVVIPSYNRANLLMRALNSVFSQDYPHFDIWAIDDGDGDGDDNTEEKVAQLKAHHPQGARLHYLKSGGENKNLGVSAARNWGIRQSRGEWIALLDSDDAWMPSKLSRQAHFLQRHPHIPLAHCEEIWIRNGRRVNPKKIHQKFGGHIFRRCLPLCLISPSSVVFKRELFEEVGGFDPDFPVCEDYDLWLKITSLYEVGFIEEPLAIKYGGHSDQLSRKFKAMDYWRVLALHRILRLRLRSLSPEDAQAVRRQIVLKGEILLKGYRKHQNMGQYNQVAEIVHMAKARLKSEAAYFSIRGASSA